jgi:hypothetical protein
MSRSEFVEAVIKLARGGPDIPAATQLTALKLIWEHWDGLPRVKPAETEAQPTSEVTYVKKPRPA